MAVPHMSEPFLIIVGPRGARNVEWTVREYAKVERVSQITVRRWIAKGAVDVRRTPGGGIRILGTK